MATPVTGGEATSRPGRLPATGSRVVTTDACLCVGAGIEGTIVAATSPVHSHTILQVALDGHAGTYLLDPAHVRYTGEMTTDIPEVHARLCPSCGHMRNVRLFPRNACRVSGLQEFCKFCHGVQYPVMENSANHLLADGHVRRKHVPEDNSVWGCA